MVRKEKENLIDIKSNDLIIDMFTSLDFNGKIEHDADIFYSKIKKWELII